MTDYSTMTDEEINEAIFKAKGYTKSRSAFDDETMWLKPIEGEAYTFDCRYDLPDYTHSWELCGELLEEMPNCSLRRWGDKWCCGFYDDKGYLVNQATVHDTPQRAICEARLVWEEQG